MGIWFCFVYVIALFIAYSQQYHDSLGIQQNYKESLFCSSILYRVHIRQKDYSLSHFGEFVKNQYDYDDVVYPIPFNKYFNDMESRYMGFGNEGLFPSYVLTGHIPAYTKGDKRLIVTGCSSNHFASVEANMVSVLNASATINVAFIDLGLSSKQIESLKRIFDYIHRVHLAMNSSSFVVYRKFNFETAPTWMNISSNNAHGGYGWKIISWMDIVNEWQSLTGWIDAGSIIFDGFDTEFNYTLKEGFYSPSGGARGGTVAQWTHRGMIHFFLTNHLVTYINLRKSNPAAGHIFVDYHNETIRKKILTPWLQCCYTMKCVLPKGSSRRNHRWEQAALTSVLQNVNLTYSNNMKYKHFPYLRMEDRPKRFLNRLTKKFKKQINQRNHIDVW